MQMNEKQTMLAGAAALALIVFGALFWIAPVWQFGYAPAAYQPPVLPAQAEPAPEPTREEQGPVNINTTIVSLVVYAIVGMNADVSADITSDTVLP